VRHHGSAPCASPWQRGGEAPMTGEGHATRTPGDAPETGTRGDPSGADMLPPPSSVGGLSSDHPRLPTPSLTAPEVCAIFSGDPPRSGLPPPPSSNSN